MDQSLHLSHLLVRANVPSRGLQQGDKSLRNPKFHMLLWKTREKTLENQRKRCKNEILKPLFTMNPLCNTTKATGEQGERE